MRCGRDSVPPVGHKKCLTLESLRVPVSTPHQRHRAFGMLGVPMGIAGFLQGLNSGSLQVKHLWEASVTFTSSLKQGERPFAPAGTLPCL